MEPTTSAPLRVVFPSGDLECVADLYLPGREELPIKERPREAPPSEVPPAHEAGDPGRGLPGGPRPVVLMAHGIGAERRYGLERYARRFVAAGLAAFVFDYRHLGDSPGEPRRLVSPARQLDDYRAALAFVREDARLDSSRIALWGTSFSGGHVLALAAESHPGVVAVVSQIPFVSGTASTLAFPLRYHLPAIVAGAADAVGGMLGMRPRTVPVVRDMVREPGLALLPSPDSHAGYLALVPGDAPPPDPVPARVFLEVLRYHPGRQARRVAVPTLLVAAGNDAICPIGATRRVAARIASARLETFPGGHFDVYRGSTFERVVELESSFLARQLLG